MNHRLGRHFGERRGTRLSARERESLPTPFWIRRGIRKRTQGTPSSPEVTGNVRNA